MQSFSFPSMLSRSLQTSEIETLFKKGSKDEPKNYRPISFLPQISKVIEQCVNEQLQEYLDRNKVLYRYQSCFHPYHLTDTCLSYVSDKIVQGFENDMFMGMILIDLQRAFDIIDCSDYFYVDQCVCCCVVLMAVE